MCIVLLTPPIYTPQYINIHTVCGEYPYNYYKCAIKRLMFITQFMAHADKTHPLIFQSFEGKQQSDAFSSSPSLSSPMLLTRPICQPLQCHPSFICGPLGHVAPKSSWHARKTKMAAFLPWNGCRAALVPGVKLVSPPSGKKKMASLQKEGVSRVRTRELGTPACARRVLYPKRPMLSPTPQKKWACVW